MTDSTADSHSSPGTHAVLSAACSIDKRAAGTRRKPLGVCVGCRGR